MHQLSLSHGTTIWFFGGHYFHISEVQGFLNGHEITPVETIKQCKCVR